MILDGPAEQALKLLTSLRPPAPAVPIVRTELADDLRRLDPRWRETGSFGWMGTKAKTDSRQADVRWLADVHLDQAEALVRAGSPDPWVLPREPGTRRWAGHFDGDTLVSVAGDAWPAPGVGFIAGVATHADHRGKGASTAVCAYLRDVLLDEHGTCGLMVYRDNDTAIRLYERLGFTYQSMTALTRV